MKARHPDPVAPIGAFRARLYRVAMVRWVDLPKREADRFELTLAENKGLNALLRFNDDLDRVTLLPGKRGHYKLAFKVELLRAAQVEAGDTVVFTRAPDRNSCEPELPREMRRAFQARPQLADKWAAHTVAIRRQVTRYILDAKSAETQTKCCWISIERLADTSQLSAD
jgi:hypothetical protein